MRTRTDIRGGVELGERTHRLRASAGMLGARDRKARRKVETACRAGDRKTAAARTVRLVTPLEIRA